ncbi:hypothetical protein R3P38DRAFT_828441 [Favolaschia claudopus]|uniref:Uncharacterized protein n=1 Tax=Favolaschia claudopus TaxID=2862362 RepID=A0AAW0BZV9_9AGAR
MEAALGVADACLAIVGGSAQFVCIPYAQDAVLLAQSIVGLIHGVRSNKEGFRNLGKEVTRLVYAIARSRPESSKMQECLKDLLPVLQDIHNFVEKRGSPSLIRRVVGVGGDAAMIHSYREQIRQAVTSFNVEAQIMIYENVVQLREEFRAQTLGQKPEAPIMRENVSLNRSLFPRPASPAPIPLENNLNEANMNPFLGPPVRIQDRKCNISGTDSTGKPYEATFTSRRQVVPANTLADAPPAAYLPASIAQCSNVPTRAPLLPLTNIGRNYSATNMSAQSTRQDAGQLPTNLSKLSAELKSSPRLRSILRVAIVFEEPPSIIRVSRILKLSVDDVCAALKPVSEYLESPVDSPESLISLFQFRNYFLQSGNGAFIATFHNQVARWCLAGNHADDLRDQFYATENWDYHVCRAERSRDLYDAMENSWIPGDAFLSHDKLPGVISWLEDSESQKHDEQAAKLLEIYKEKSASPPPMPQVMRGMLNLPLRDSNKPAAQVW